MATKRVAGTLEARPALPTMNPVANKKKNPDRHKARRIVGIPEALAVALEGVAADQFNTLAEQVKIAVREYLERLNRLPSARGRPKAEGG